MIVFCLFQCLGNHEFDLGAKGVHEFISGIKFPTVAANVDFSREAIFNGTTVPKSVVLEVAGRKIGIIGYLTPTTKEISFTQNVVLTDEIEAVKAESEKLNEQGVKIIIALGHSGFQKDKELAKKVPLVDLVVGGHTNTFLWNGDAPDLEQPEGPYPYVVTQTSGKQVPVVQAYAYTKYIGRLNVTFDDSGNLIKYAGQPLLLDDKTPQDIEITKQLAIYRPAVEELDNQVVGKSRVFLDGDAKSCRFNECNFGNLIADAFIAYRASVAASTYWTDAPIALFNGGAVRGGINASEFGGNITRGELLGALPFQNPIITLSLNGTDLIKTLELAARSDGETSRGEFLQVSGLKVVYDYDRPSMSRVVSVKVRCAECDVPTYSDVVENATYRVVTTVFLSGGGDGHYILQYNGFNKAIEDLDEMSVVEWYIGKKSPVFPEVFGRIIINGTRSDSCDDSASSPIYTVSWLTFVVFAALISIVR